MVAKNIMNRFKKKWISAVVMALSVMLCAVPAFAADIDLSRDGSIDVIIHAYASDETVSGGTLELYRIADAYYSDTDGYGYTYTSDFAGCDESLLTEEGLGLSDTADTFADWIEKADIPASVSSTVDTEGAAYFADLPCGLYMIMQGMAADGYNAVNPFLVTVPVLENGTWIYNVDATPKTSPVTKVTETPKSENPPTVGNPTTGNPSTKNPDTTGTGTNPSSRVKTGDNTPIVGITIIIVAAVVALIVVIRRRRMA